MIQILVVDDDPAALRAWRRMAASQQLPVELLTATTIAEARSVLEEKGHSIAGVVLDYRLQPGCGLELVPDVRRRSPLAIIALVTSFLDTEVWLAAKRIGVDAVPKPDSWRKLSEMLSQILRPPAWSARELYPDLSDRESEVLEQAVAGATDTEIAEELGLSESTVATYWDRIREKTGLPRRLIRAALASNRRRRG